MNLEYPYQLVAFLAKEPCIGEPVYGGANGWYAQIALKRRFRINGISEAQLLESVEHYASSFPSFVIQVGSLYKPDSMPVHVLAVEPSPELMNFHQGFITLLADTMTSRYPERDGADYLPHITAEYAGKMVVDKALFANRQFRVGRICLLKDQASRDSEAYAYFDLG